MVRGVVKRSRAVCRALVATIVLVWTIGGCRAERAVVQVQEPADPPVTVPVPLQDMAGWIGVIVPAETIDVATTTPARLLAIRVNTGARVRRGDILAELDRRLLDQEILVAEAALSAARAEHDRSVVRASREQREHERRASIPEAFSREAIQAAGMEAQEAIAAMEAAAARRDQEAASVERLRTLRSDSLMRAPFDGVVSRRFLDPGAVTGPGTPILELVSDGELTVRFAVPVHAAATVALGEIVSVWETPESMIAEATVTVIAPSVNVGSQMVVIEARIEWPEQLHGGLGVHVGRRVAQVPEERGVRHGGAQ